MSVNVDNSVEIGDFSPFFGIIYYKNVGKGVDKLVNALL